MFNVVTRRTAPRVTLIHEAAATSLQEVQFAHYARGGWLGHEEFTHFASTQPWEEVELVHDAFAFLTRPASPGQPAPAPRPALDIIHGVRPLIVTAESPLGPLISAEYSDDGAGPTATLVLPGEVVPAVGAAVAITVISKGQSGRAGAISGPAGAPKPRSRKPYEFVTTRTEVHLVLDDQYEISGARGGLQTTLRAYAPAATALGTTTLPELVPFMATPTPRPTRDTPCTARLQPQTAPLGPIVRQAVAAAGLSLTVVGGRAGRRGLDRIRDAVLDQRQVAAAGAGRHLPRHRVPAGHSPRGQRDPAAAAAPGVTEGGLQVSGDQVISSGTRRWESAHFPASVTVTGADLLVPLPRLQDLIDLAPDPESFDQAMQPDKEWTKIVPSPDGKGEVITGYKRVNGQLVGLYRLTVQDLTVQEQVDGKTVTVPFGRVATSLEETETTYHPTCTDMLLRQEVRKMTWSYTVATRTRTEIVGRYGYMGVAAVGDLLGDEIEVLEQHWSPEGWLRTKIQRSRKLSSVKQSEPEGELKDRGPVKAHEYVERLRTEDYLPDGLGWVMLWQETGGIPVVLYDEESLEAVRLSVRAGTLTSGMDKMDAAPTSVRCPDPCAVRKRALPNSVRVTSPQGKQGAAVTRTVGWTRDRAKLERYARMVMQSLAPRMAVSRSKVQALPVAAGMGLTPKGPEGLEGNVQNYGWKAEGAASLPT
ncbi:hypothetical protein [Deinococcus multiflagellatus]|uniref:Uncharacterized protein n=1 Tax=Deinococcus multiflagellatus TaxID=1656887 RepID=A0ABW1ZUK0_9DEIO